MRAFTDAHQWQLLKNMIYVGALASLLGIEFPVLETLLAEQFAGEERLIAPHIGALKLGVNYVQEHFLQPIGFHLERRDSIGDSMDIPDYVATCSGISNGSRELLPLHPGRF